MPISDVALRNKAGGGGGGSGWALGGKLEGGALRPGTRVMVVPGGEVVVVKALEVDGQVRVCSARQPCLGHKRSHTKATCTHTNHAHTRCAMHVMPTQPAAVFAPPQPAKLARAGDSVDVTVPALESAATSGALPQVGRVLPGRGEEAGGGQGRLLQASWAATVSAAVSQAPACGESLMHAPARM